MSTTAKMARDIKLEVARKAKTPKAAMPAPQPMLALRAPAGVPAQIRHLPLVFPPARSEMAKIPGVVKASLVGASRRKYDERIPLPTC